MKYLMVVMDGVADQPLRELGGQTPLEVAHKPNLDRLARCGQVGLVRPIPAGFAPGTDIGSLSLFGLDPARYDSGRGPLEAAQLNVPLERDHVAFRCNLVTVKEGRLEDYSAGHISVAEAHLLIQEVDQRLGVNGLKLYPGASAGYRHVAVVTNHRDWLEAQLTPPHDIMGQAIERHQPQGSGGRELWAIQLASQEILGGHPVNQRREAAGAKPANMIWLWGQGCRPSFPQFRDRFGLSGAVITAVDLIKGIGRYLGLEIINVPGATGYLDTNYRGKAEYALEALRRHDFVFLHIEATDEAGHMGDPRLKIQAIEDIDRLLIGTLVDGLSPFGDVRVVVTSDHATCCATRTHDAMPVPILLYDSSQPRSQVSPFTEKASQASGWMIDPGHQVIEVLLGRSAVGE